MASQKTMLDDLSGFEFEKLMMDVFRNLGYENVRNPGKTGDEGRDIIMEKDVDGVRTTFIVECKNLSSNVNRPVVQKLHSAVSTFETDNRKKGMVVTTNGFSSGAREYAEKSDIELWDGKKIREISDEVGLNLYNGEIEIICDKVLPIPDKRRKIEEKVLDEFSDLRNFDREVVDDIEVEVELVPALFIETEIDSKYETTVGVVNQIQRTETVIWRGDVRGRISDRKDSDIQKLISASNRRQRLDSVKSDNFDNIEKRHFEKTETGFKEDIIQHQIRQHTEEVTYTGGNNVTYNKTHKPRKKDIHVNDIASVYVPKIRSETKIEEHTHSHHYLTDTYLEVKKKDEVNKDTKKDKEPLFFTPTLCQYCGTINDRFNIKKESLEDEPICKHCSRKKRFMLRKKHFKNQENLDKFEQKYKEMPLHHKLLENKIGIISTVVASSYILLTL